VWFRSSGSPARASPAVAPQVAATGTPASKKRAAAGLNREKLADMTTPGDRASDDHRAELIRQTAELKDVAGRVGLDVAFREPGEDLEDATAATMFVVWRRGEPMPTGNDQSFLTFDQARDFIARYTDVPTPRDGRA
jgi:hypothetical protein